MTSDPRFSLPTPPQTSSPMQLLSLLVVLCVVAVLTEDDTAPHLQIQQQLKDLFPTEYHSFPSNPSTTASSANLNGKSDYLKTLSNRGIRTSQYALISSSSTSLPDPVDLNLFVEEGLRTFSSLLPLLPPPSQPTSILELGSFEGSSAIFFSGEQLKKLQRINPFTLAPR